MTLEEKMNAAKQKMGGSFPWQRPGWKYHPADDTDITKTFEHAIESAEFETDFQREEQLLKGES